MSTYKPEKRTKGTPGAVCTRTGCNRSIHVPKWGLCKSHYGVELKAGRLQTRSNEPLTDLHAPCSYDAARQRVGVQRGTAKVHPCIRCGEKATRWTYIPGTSANEQQDDDPRSAVRSPRTYSGDPFEWVPSCFPCVSLMRKGE